MAKGPLTLLDIAIRNGDKVGAVVDDVTTTAPEWGIVPAVRREGTSYDVLLRTALASGGFRNVGSGVEQSKGAWDRKTKPMYFFDCQMDVDEAIVQAQTAASMATTGDVLADESINSVRGSAINFGSQFYYGTDANADGFAGISGQVAAGGDLDAGGGTGSDTTSVYLCWLDPSEINPQGVHFSVGNKGTFSFGQWLKQQVVVKENNKDKRAMHWVNNFSFYVGLAVASSKSVYRIKRIKTGHGWSDDLAAQLISTVPISRRANLRWFANPNAGYLLQKSRTTALLPMVDLPTSCQNIPITYTDSIVNTETDGELAA